MKSEISDILDTRRKKREALAIARIVTATTLFIMGFMYFIPSSSSVRLGLMILTDGEGFAFQLIISIMEVMLLTAAVYVLLSDAPDETFNCIILIPEAVAVFFSFIAASEAFDLRFTAPITLLLLFFHMATTQLLATRMGV